MLQLDSIGARFNKSLQLAMRDGKHDHRGRSAVMDLGSHLPGGVSSEHEADVSEAIRKSRHPASDRGGVDKELRRLVRSPDPPDRDRAAAWSECRP